MERQRRPLAPRELPCKAEVGKTEAGIGKAEAGVGKAEAGVGKIEADRRQGEAGTGCCSEGTSEEELDCSLVDCSGTSE